MTGEPMTNIFSCEEFILKYTPTELNLTNLNIVTK